MVVVVVLVVVLVAVMILVLVTVPVLIPVVVAVPTVIVFEPAAISFPVTRIKLLSVMVRSDPPSACIGRPRPIALMPPIVMAGWIPIAVYPREFRAWTWRHNPDRTGTRGRANPDTQRNLSLGCRGTAQQYHG
jgi:hypothetical protein